MEGRRAIVLLQPIDVAPNSDNELVPRYWKRHIITAIRKDKPSDSSGFIGEDITGQNQIVEFTIRESSVYPRPSIEWKLIDDIDQQYKINGVAEQVFGSRRRHLILTCLLSNTGA